MKEKATSMSMQYVSTCALRQTPINYPDPPTAVIATGPGATTSLFKLSRTQHKSLRHLRHLPYDLNLWRVRSQASIAATREYAMTYTYMGNRLRRRDSYAGQVLQEKHPVVTIVGTDLEGHLINQCYMKIKDQKFDLSITALESRQTLDLIGNTTRRLSDGLQAIARRDFRKAARILNMRKPKESNLGKSYADNLLAYQFGWLQLVSDISGAAMSLHAALYRAPFLSCNAWIAKGRTGFLQYDSKYPEHADSWATVSSRFTGKDIIKVSLVFSLDDNFLRTMSQVGMSNPANTAWQARPLSFLFGWLFSVNEVLASFDALAGLQFVTGSTSRCTKGKFVTQIEQIKWPHVPGLSANSVRVNLQRTPGETDLVLMRRDVHREMPPPQFMIRNPLGGNSLGKTVTSVAITRQLLEGEIRRSGNRF